MPIDVAKLRSVLIVSLGELEDDDIAEFIAQEVAQEIEDMPSEAELAEMDLEQLTDLPVSSLLQAHISDLLGQENTSILLISSILDAYWAPVEELVEDEQTGRIRECELCDRAMPLTAHHLLPRNEHDRLVKRNLFTLQECRSRLAWLCRPCHSAVHRAANTASLAEEYNTVEKLLDLEEVAKFAAYASKQRPNTRGSKHIGLKHAR